MDCIRGLGPDIYVGTIGDAHFSPTTSTWSHWTDRHEPTPLSSYLASKTIPGTMTGNRGRQRYDFRRRKYRDVDKIANMGSDANGAGSVWSWVEYCRDPTCRDARPVRYWDGNGELHEEFGHNEHLGEGTNMGMGCGWESPSFPVW
jgi:hypothetical protein